MKVLGLGEVVSYKYEYNSDTETEIVTIDNGAEIELGKYTLVETEELKNMLNFQKEYLQKQKFAVDRQKEMYIEKSNKLSEDIYDIDSLLRGL